MPLDISEISPSLFVGSCLEDGADIDELKSTWGITAVLNLQTDDDFSDCNIDWRSLEGEYQVRQVAVRRVPIRDGSSKTLETLLPDAVQAALELAGSQPKVLIHCTEGTNRAPTAAIAYLHWVEGWDLSKAEGAVLARRDCRPQVQEVQSATPRWEQLQRPPLIADQRLQLLRADAPDRRGLLSPEALSAGRQEKADHKAAEGRSSSTPYWELVSRHQLFFEKDLHRLCIVTNAGIGKTTLLQWAEQAWGHHDASVLAIYIESHNLPASRQMFLGGGDPGNVGVLVNALLSAPGNVHASPIRCRQILERLIGQGRFVLLVDGLDQTRSYSARQMNPKIAALVDFLRHEGRDCRVVVAGRPHAVDRYWEDLFESDEWRFAQLEQFTPEQTVLYLGPQRLKHLEQLDVEILSVPRSLQVIRQFRPHQLRDLRTASDVYWKCVQSMLRKVPVVDRSDGRFTVDEALWLFGAMAFQMSLEGNFEGISEGEFTDFKRALWRRQVNNSPWDSSEHFETKLNLLGETNEFLEFGFLEGYGLKQVFWRNRTLQEFFAGLWMARFASRKDSRVVGRRVYHPDHKASVPFYWQWRFASEMPHGGRNQDRWLASMRTVYRRRNRWLGLADRPTEMIYRSWRTMDAARHSGKAEEEGFWHAYEDALLIPLRNEFREIVGRRFRDQSAGRGVNGGGGRWPTLRQLVASFHWVQRRRGRHLLAEFRPIPRDYNSPGDLEFRMGSPLNDEERFDEGPWETKLAEPFELACYPVTNGQYELFDPSHRRNRNRKSRWARQPVTGVSWYDAWAYCLWLGEGFCLPTEKQWEFACRAGSRGRYCLGEKGDPVDERTLGDYAWYSINSGSKTHTVGQKKPNLWGLYDMHGNVFEWCGTWYAKDLERSNEADYGLDRVFRGGGWYVVATYCRSAFRHGGTPDDRGDYLGFRVASIRGKPSQ